MPMSGCEWRGYLRMDTITRMDAITRMDVPGHVWAGRSKYTLLVNQVAARFDPLCQLIRSSSASTNQQLAASRLARQLRSCRQRRIRRKSFM